MAKEEPAIYSVAWYRAQWKQSARDLWNKISEADAGSLLFEKLKILTEIRSAESIRIATWTIGIFTAVQALSAFYSAYHPLVIPSAQVIIQPTAPTIQSDNLKAVFEKLKGKRRIEITLENNKMIRGKIAEISDSSVAVNNGTDVEYISYRAVLAARELTSK